METAAARIIMKNVGRTFAGSSATVEKMDLRVDPGEFVSLLGPSGCGKSTLLRLMAGLDRPTSGSIAVEASSGRLSRGFVFQEAALMPWLTVLENVALPLRLGRAHGGWRLGAHGGWRLGAHGGWRLGRAHGDPAGRAREALVRVGLEDSLTKFPNQLSGGMKMRVSVARALVGNPALLLLDEPFAALDENTRHRLQVDLRALWVELKMTVVFVTHSVSEAVFLSDRTVMLSQKPARILLDRPVSLGRERSYKLRTDARYAAEVEAISQGFATEEVLP